MKRALVLMALLAGCNGQMPDVVMPDKPSVTMLDTISAIRHNVQLAGRLVGLVCESQGSSSEVCTTLEMAWRGVTLALGETDRVVDAFAKHGVGFEAVLKSVDVLFDAIKAMDDAVAQGRAMVTSSALSSHERAVAVCPGFGAWSAESSKDAQQHPTTATPVAVPK